MQLYETNIQQINKGEKITFLYLYHMIQFTNITPARVLFPQYLHLWKCAIDFFYSSVNNKLIFCYILDTILSVLVQFHKWK